MRSRLIIYLLILSVIGGATSNVFATESKENMYLIQMLNQLNALKPLLYSAKKEQDSHARVKFHYTDYRDADGHVHNGLLEDIHAIQQGIQAKLNKPLSTPRYFESIKGDYIGLHRVNKNVR